MNIKIHEPELQAIIQERMKSGSFESVEDFLLKTIRRSDAAPKDAPDAPKKNFAVFLQESPLAGSGLKLDRIRDYPRPAEV